MGVNVDAYPKTLAEMEQAFSSEEACREYLIGLRWPDGFRCPDCGHEGGWVLGDGLHKCKRCGHKSSVTAETMAELTKGL